MDEDEDDGLLLPDLPPPGALGSGLGVVEKVEKVQGGEAVMVDDRGGSGDGVGGVVGGDVGVYTPPALPSVDDLPLTESPVDVFPSQPSLQLQALLKQQAGVCFCVRVCVREREGGETSGDSFLLNSFAEE